MIINSSNYSFVIISFDDFQEINSKDLKNHAEMVTVGSFINKTVQKLNDMGIISIEMSTIFLIYIVEESIVTSL